MKPGLPAVRAAIVMFTALCAAPQLASAQLPDSTRSTSAPSGPSMNISSEARMSLQMESLSNGAAAWHDASFEITSSAGSPGRWFAAFHEVGRFSMRDETFGGGYVHALGKRTVFSIEAQGSFSHRVVPRYALAGRIDAPVGRGWVLNSGVSGRRYDSGDVTILSAGVEKYVGRFRLAYTSFGALLSGKGSASHALSFDTSYGSGGDNVFGVTVSAGDELEQDVRAELRTTAIRAMSARGRHWIGRGIGVLYTIGIHEQGPDYTRRGGTAGIAFRF